uniref:Tetraspanin n=1 Tax=Timema shepardi TaxID=629360 RepID=A0A7R9AVC4_TIMSH|nr:unnamed protein product [Timema shepardi]
MSRSFPVQYFSLVIFMFLFEFLIATLAFVFRENLGHVLREELKTGIELHYNATHPNSLDSIWTHIHEEVRVSLGQSFLVLSYVGKTGYRSPESRQDETGIFVHMPIGFHCCGVSGYEDWYDISAWKGQRFVPDSCCDIKFSNITDCGRSHNPDMWYTKGCAEQVQMWFVERLHIVGIVGLVVAFIQLFGLISSMLLFCTVRHKRSSHTYKSYDPTT